MKVTMKEGLGNKAEERAQGWKTAKGLQIVRAGKGFVAYNSVLGGLRKLRSNEIQCIQKIREGTFEPGMVSAITLDQLKLDVFIQAPGSLDEYQILQPAIKNYNRRLKDGGTITKLMLLLTEDCMLRCKYCYLEDAPGAFRSRKRKETGKNACITLNKGSRRMSWDTARKSINVFQQIIENNGQKVVHVRFHGGEPLIHWNVIRDSILYIESTFQRVRCIFHMNTNGILLTEDIAKFWSSRDADIEISLDGPRKVHDSVRHYENGQGSFDKAICATRRLLAGGLPQDKLNFACTLSSANIRHLLELVDLTAAEGLRSLEINVFYFNHPLDILDRLEERVDALVDARIYGVKKGVEVTGKWFKLFPRLTNPVLNYCGRFGQQIGVDPDGNIIGCSGYLKSFGHIDGFNEVFKSSKYQRAVQRIVGSIKECTHCSIEGMCAGGCLAAAGLENGDYYHADSKECQFRRRMVTTLINRMDEIKGRSIDVETVDPSYIATFESYREVS